MKGEQSTWMPHIKLSIAIANRNKHRNLNKECGS